MTVTFDRKIFFDKVRGPLFGGKLTQQQVDGMEFKLSEWENKYWKYELRWLAYCLATSKHETASKMWPIEEYSKGEGAEYGKPDPVTGWAYYGRGDVQLTWADNYKKATKELGLVGGDDLYWYAPRALDPRISADVLFLGMGKGWFRPPHKLGDYFNETKDDAFNARDIVNGDKNTVPDWSKGASIGKLISDYHKKFLSALKASMSTAPEPPKPPEPTITQLRISLLVKVSSDGKSTAEVTECVTL